jgi:hypothetical protein
MRYCPGVASNREAHGFEHRFDFNLAEGALRAATADLRVGAIQGVASLGVA